MGQTLSLHDRIRIACYCGSSGGKHPGWTVNQNGPGMVCSQCRRPSPMTVLRVCMWCDKEFELTRDSIHWQPIWALASDGELVRNEFGCSTCEPL